VDDANSQPPCIEDFTYFTWSLSLAKDAANVVAATNYFQRCMTLGGQWLHWNQFTKRLECLYLKKAFKEEMERASAP